MTARRAPARNAGRVPAALFALLAGLLLALPAHRLTAQEAAPPAKEATAAAEAPKVSDVDERLRSPSQTMVTFIQAMNRAARATEASDETRRAAALEEARLTLDLSQVNAERGDTLAARLLGIINRLGYYQTWFLWKDGEASDRREQTYFPHPRFDHVVADAEPRGRIVMARQDDGNWRFSADTVAGIDALFLSLESLPILVGADERAIQSGSWLRDAMPVSLKGQQVLTLEYWQWALLLVFIFLGVVLDYTFRMVVRGAASRFIRRQGGTPDPASMRLTVRPAGLLVMALFWLNMVWLLALPDVAYTIVQGAARVFAVLAGAFFAWRLTDLLADALARKALTTDNKFDDAIIPLARTTLKIFIVIFGLIYGGLSLNFDITPLLASLTIGGVGFAFAAKDTLENFFGSATVLVDQPFGVGDWVVIGDVEGTVETIGFRSTRIRTFYNSLVTVPNANLVRANVDNYGHRKYRRWKTTLGVTYDTPPERLTAFVEGIRELVRTHPYTRKDYFQVYLNGFGPSSLDVLLYIFHETPDWSTELRERERLMLDIMRLAEHLGVEFAFPTQTLHLHQAADAEAPGEVVLPDARTDARATRAGITAARAVTAEQSWRRRKPGPVDFHAGPAPLPDDEYSQVENRTAGS